MGRGRQRGKISLGGIFEFVIVVPVPAHVPEKYIKYPYRKVPLQKCTTSAGSCVFGLWRPAQRDSAFEGASFVVCFVSCNRWAATGRRKTGV